MSRQGTIITSNERASSKAVQEGEKHKPLVYIFYDNQPLCDLLEEEIEKKKELRFISASEMDNALSLYESHSPDCIILMNTTDTIRSLEFYQAVCDQPSSLTIPVIYVCSQNKEEIKLAYEHGIEEIFPLYLGFDELYLKIKVKINKNSVIKNIQQEAGATELYDESLFKKMYQLQLSDLARLRTPFTLVCVGIKDYSEIKHTYGPLVAEQMMLKISRYVSTQIRDSDLAFRLDQANLFAILLRYSGDKEAGFFVTRLLTHVPVISVDGPGKSIELRVHLAASIVEIGNTSISFEEAMERGHAALQEALLDGHSHVQVVDAFREPRVEKIKVSIVESDAVIRNVLLNLIRRMQHDYFEFEIQTYEDGFRFLESPWSQSSHKHIVILDDVLPKKNGLEVLHELRNRPNTEKYIVIMLSTRKSDSDLIYAFEMGADDYITKPFNLRLLESRIKRFIERLR